MRVRQSGVPTKLQISWGGKYGAKREKGAK